MRVAFGKTAILGSGTPSSKSHQIASPRLWYRMMAIENHFWASGSWKISLSVAFVGTEDPSPEKDHQMRVAM